MQDFFDAHVREYAPDSLAPIVIGGHPEAEMTDRALGYRLREMMRTWQEDTACPAPLAPLVCCDLWYLNDQTLRLRPTVCIGRPELNAATAYLAARLPTAFILEERFRIQLDPELVDVNVCLWGVSPQDTIDALELFRDRYLDAYLQRIHDLPSDAAAS